MKFKLKFKDPSIQGFALVGWCLRQPSNAKETQLKAPKAPYNRFFRAWKPPLCH